VSERAVATVNLAAIERNCALLRAQAPALCAVVKADAYGHGAIPCARAALAGGASWLAVATAAEAAELRAAKIDAPLLVLGALTRTETELALGCGADVCAWSEEFAGWLAPGARVHVKFDSGMGRLGTRDPAEAARVLAAVDAAPGAELVGLMTHFATADERGDAFFGEQLARFQAWLSDVRRPGVVVHAANSAALLRGGAAFDMARCGVAIYGLDPFNEDAGAHGLEPALELHSWVAAVKPCRAGESAGYGRRFIAAQDTCVAVVPVGYGDGVRRALTNNAEVLVGGARHPLVGTVSMDNITLDVGLPAAVAVGERATLIGEGVPAEEMARRLGTINYEITCGLSARVPRRHHRDGTPAP
jgi:alanine racemase